VNQYNKAFFFLILTAILWSTGGIFIKSISWDSQTLAGMRSLVAAIALLSWRRTWRVRFSWIMFMGAICYAFTLISFVAATKLTTAANAILLQYTAPVYIAAFGAWFLKENFHLRDFLTMGLVLTGMVLFFFDKLSTFGTLGNLIAIFSGICFGWLILFLRKQKEARPLDTIYLGNILVVLFTLPFMRDIAIQPGNWTLITIMGGFQIALPYILYASAIRHIRAIEVILITALEPILNPLWVFIFVGERPGPWAIFGGLIVMGSILMHQIIGKTHFPKEFKKTKPLA